MHSRIFQISKTKIDVDNIKTSCDYEDHWFVGSIADYVINSNDKYGDLEWLSNLLISRLGKLVEYNEKNRSICFKEGFKEAYFELNFTKFKDLSKNMSLEDFSSSQLEVYKIKALIADDFSFYFDEDGHTLCMDSFIRESAVHDVDYFIGGIIDYHS